MKSHLTPQQIVDLLLHPKLALDLTPAQSSYLIFVLRENRSLARFSYLAKNAGIVNQLPNKVKHHLNASKIKADRQIHQAQFEAEELTKNLKKINVTPIFLKGVAYTVLQNKTSLGRTYSDMDVLVKKNELTKVEQYLSLYGWFSKKSNDYDQKYYRQWAHEIPPMYQGIRGTIADIHHNIIPPISGKAPDISLFSQEIITTKNNLHTLSKHGLTLHSIIHLFFNEDFTHAFRDIFDLHLLFTQAMQEHDEIFWQALFDLAIKTRFNIELFYAVRYCSKILGTKFPQEFYQKVQNLKPNKTQLRVADFIFLTVLYPRHSSYKSLTRTLKESLAVLRGHLLKMPLHILLYHSCHKIIDKLLSKNEDKTNVV